MKARGADMRAVLYIGSHSQCSRFAIAYCSDRSGIEEEVRDVKSERHLRRLKFGLTFR